MNKSKIEWTDFSWNPLKGLCPVDCKLPDGKSYCYARRMYQNPFFGFNPKIELDGELFGSCQHTFAPNINVYKKLERIKPGSKIFICSTFELFHPSVFKEWRDAIFQAIKEHPKLIFQILTKFPQNVDREMPDNVCLGITLTGAERWGGFEELKYFEYKVKSRVKFISHEPLLFDPIINISFINWIIIGRLTGHGNKYDPQKSWIQGIVNKAEELKIPIFLKDNLIPIMGKEYVTKHRAFPK